MLTTTQAGLILKLSRQRVQALCIAGRVVGAVKYGRDWLIPAPPVILPGNPPGRPRKPR